MTILIIDDDKSVRLSLAMLLKKGGYDTLLASCPDEALEIVRSCEVNLILMDMNYELGTTGEEGIELLRKCRVLKPEVPVILITAWGSIPLAVEGMHAGAYDFITKPWDNCTLLRSIQTAIQLSGSKSVTVPDSEFDRCGIIGKSKGLTDVLDTVARVAPTDASVLILGENGTGKELIAQAIHANSPRRNRPFVMVNLGGIPQNLFESEMFGHVRGAFTGAVGERKGRFELAHTGTIFLDEIGDLDPLSQVKMLRVLQQHSFEALGDSHPRKVDVRVVCATNANLAAKVADNTFREDLYYRINLITLKLPPLRERRDDIPLLARHFARELAKSTGREVADIGADAMEWLSRRPYPGNIRELKNLIERTIIINGNDDLTVQAFERAAEPDLTMTDVRSVPASDETLEELERSAIVSALHKCSGNLSKAAMLLGITRQSLYRRMDKFGIKQ